MLNQDFKEFIQSLNANGVRYLIVGGCAENFLVPDQIIQLGYPLKKNKRAAGRLQDLADLANLGENICPEDQQALR